MLRGASNAHAELTKTREYALRLSLIRFQG